MSDADSRDNPFVGLRPFFDEDSFYFFGRNDQVTQLLELLHSTRFVPVLGSSGSGKSSLVRAGLIPTLKAGFMVAERDGWRMAKCLPGDAPIENLAESLLRAVGVQQSLQLVNSLASRIREDFADAVVELLQSHVSAHENVLILVDQFEELFAFRSAAGTDADDEPGTVPDAARTADRLRRRQDASLLVSLLLALAERKDLPVYIVTTMRTDFLGDCDIFTGLPEAINLSGYLLPRLTRAQLRSAIEGPARLMGARAAPRLVDRVLNDVGDRMDRLPLMQHALRRTYDAWRDAGMMGPIDIQDLDKIGGLDGALGTQADATISDIDPLLAERVFKRLTGVDKNQRRVRHPARLNDLRAVAGAQGAAGLKTLLDRCVREGTNFMFASADGQPANPRYNITHESLIRQWRTLSKWVDEEEVQRNWYLAVSSRAAMYAADPDSGLMSRRDLRVAREMLNERQPTAEWAARYPEAAANFETTVGYVTRSEAFVRSVRTRRIAGAAALLLMIVVATGLVIRSGAQVKRVLAQVNDVARFSAIEKLLDEDPTYAAALAAELTDTTAWRPDRIALLQRAINGDYATAEYRDVANFDVDGTGTEIAIAYGDGQVEIGDIDGRGAPSAVYKPEVPSFPRAVFFARKRAVVAGYDDGSVKLWQRTEAASATPEASAVRTWTLPQGLTQLAVAADSVTLLAVDDSSHMYAWSLQDSMPRRMLPGERVREFYVHPSDAHRTAVITRPEAGGPDSVRVLDVTTGRVIATVKGVGKSVAFLSLQTGSDEMFVGQNRGKVLYVRGDRVAGAVGDSTNYTAAFNPVYDNVALVSTTFGFIDLYSLSRSEPPGRKPFSSQSRFLAHDDLAQSQFSRDGDWTLSWSSDRTLRWTSTFDSTVSTRLIGHKANVFRAATSPGDSRIVSLDMDGTLRVWRKPGAAQAVRTPLIYGPLWSAELSADGQKVLLGTADGSFEVRSFADSSANGMLRNPLMLKIAAVLSPRGTRVFFDPVEGASSLVWTVRDSAPVPLPASKFAVMQAVFSDDDSVLVVARDGGRLTVHDARTGALLQKEYVHEGGPIELLAIVPHSHTAVITSGARVLRVDRDSAKEITRAQSDALIELKFSADGSTFMMVTADGGVELATIGAPVAPDRQNAETAAPLMVSEDVYPSATAISGNGRLVAIATVYGSITVYAKQGAQAEQRAYINRIEGSIAHLAFSADQRSLIATGGDGDIHIWALTPDGDLVENATQLELRHTPKVPHQRGLPYSFTVMSPDGKRVSSVMTGDGTFPRIGVWDLSFPSIQQRLVGTTSACIDDTTRRRLLPNETDEERAERTDACERRAGRKP